AGNTAPVECGNAAAQRREKIVRGFQYRQTLRRLTKKHLRKGAGSSSYFENMLSEERLEKFHDPATIVRRQSHGLELFTRILGGLWYLWSGVLLTFERTRGSECHLVLESLEMNCPVCRAS